MKHARYRPESWDCGCGESFEFMCDVGDASPAMAEFRCIRCAQVQVVRGRLLSAAWKDGETWVALTVV